MELKSLLFEKSGKIGVITLNRPDVRNAISMEMFVELHELVKNLNWEGEVSVLIFKGAGRGFSSGYDVDDIDKREDFSFWQDLMRNNEGLRAYESLRKCSMVTIGQLHGFCLNGATDLCCQLDFIIAADDCQIGMPVVRILGTGLVNAWIYHIGPQWAKYMSMTGDTIDGSLAAKIGFAIKSVPEDKLEKTVMSFAERLTNVDRELLGLHKGIVNKGLDLMGYRTMQDYAAEIDSASHQSNIVRRNFNRTSGMGIKALSKIINQGFKPQKEPFEPIE
ncbi:MAG: enoyl-CoA hydratase-related protein [Dehalococcoidia bacterium]|nr:enoyl-CoA hydratase-related protein [Dehalococcoidia bacterium]MDD5494344.1 enoyl-CoA hydratase-related protein [Dehalococcoidia bacterium]